MSKTVDETGMVLVNGGQQNQMALYADLGIAKEDVMAIAVSKRELELDAALRETRAMQPKVAEAITKQQAKVDAATKKIAESKLLAEANSLVTSLEKAGYLSKLRTTEKKSRVEVSGHLIVAKAGKKAKLQCVAKVRLDRDPEDRYSSGTQICKSVECPVPKVITKLDAELSRLRKCKSQIEERVLTIRQEQADIPNLERKARARLAAMSLRQTEQGREVLASIEGFETPKLPELPQL